MIFKQRLLSITKTLERNRILNDATENSLSKEVMLSV